MIAAIVIVVFFSLWVISGYLPTMNIQTPEYQVIQKTAAYEIRLYEPYIVAETLQKGSREESLSSGFNELFKYITGDNVSRSKIRMTAPVLQSGEAEGQKIPMTAPVLKYEDAGSSMIAFVMPPHSRLEELPKPKSAAVKLRVVPARTIAVIRFSGFATEDAIKKHTDELQSALKRDGRLIRSAAEVALYNPPWTPPFMRRNEIVVELIPDCSWIPDETLKNNS
jgi:hypothetical protein